MDLHYTNDSDLEEDRIHVSIIRDKEEALGYTFTKGHKDKEFHES